jgi:uncharacterized membrane protein YtjA (UPF0391 family)
MLNWSITFFIIAIIAAVFGFTGIAVSAAGIAKILFGIFLRGRPFSSVGLDVE